MKIMKTLLFLILASVLSSNSFALNNKTDELKEIKQSVTEQNRHISSLEKVNDELKKSVDYLSIKQKDDAKKIDSLKSEINKLAEKDNSIEGGLTDANKKIDDNAKASDDKISSRTTWGIGAGIVLLVVALLVYLILYRRINSKTSSINGMKKVQGELQKAQAALQEESLKLDNKMIELLDKQLDVSKQQTSQPASSNQKPDHSLALKVADEIVRIKTNLMRMDASVKGHKQLSKAVERIEANFLANGYEIVDMLGKPYVEGVKAAVTFIDDDTLKPGDKVITKVIKPQINYNNIMIQAAQIEVSQNI